MMEGGTIPLPFEPTDREKYLAKRLYDDADAIEARFAHGSDLAGAVRQLALRGYNFADIGRGDEAYVRGVIDTLRRCSLLILTRGSQGIA